MSDIASLSGRMAEAVTGLLNDLTPEQRRQVRLSFDDEKERRSWYYTPTPRAGLPLLGMSPKQQQSVRRLLATALSEPGYNHVATVIGLEYVVDYWANFPDRTYGDLPGTRVRDPQNYCVAIFGEPGDANGWSWRIGGHHIALQFTVKDDAISPLPAFFGAEPHRLRMAGGVELRPMAAQEDFGRELLAMLTPAQRERAVISDIPPTDVVQYNLPRIIDGAINDSTGTGPSGAGLRGILGLTADHEDKLRYSLQPKGLPAADLDSAQREAFGRLVGVYMEHVAEPIAEQYASLLQPAGLDALTFAWAGGDARNAPIYYRVQGERLLIEYDCTQDGANHTHAVWRDPLGDFGDDILAGHYAAAHT
ncbi:MAG: DUF3500 domain-containing protein [Dehalococcoidia bacterium]|nr:DUF3500 domain-containing protein [Dehalococcoidia bacterium]